MSGKEGKRFITFGPRSYLTLPLEHRVAATAAVAAARADVGAAADTQVAAGDLERAVALPAANNAADTVGELANRREPRVAPVVVKTTAPDVNAFERAHARGRETAEKPALFPCSRGR